MAQDHESFALAFWRSLLRAKQKPPRANLEGAFESIYYCSRFVFFALAGLLRESPPPDPKLQPLLHTSAGDESVAMLFR
jgi:hypothetical protein